MEYVITDAGRSVSGYLDGTNNDCVVRAYSIVTGLSYVDCFRLLQLWGRKDNKGVRLTNFFNSNFQLFPFLWYTVPYKGFTLNHFSKCHSHGKFIVAIKRHAFAVIDGVVYDGYRPSIKSRIEFYIRIF